MTTSVEGRLRTVEKRLARIGNPHNALLMAPIVKGEFTAGDIDGLFEVIHGTFRAAALAAVAVLAAYSPLAHRPGTVLGDFATYIGQPWVRIPFELETNLAHCKRVLICSEDLRNDAVSPELDNRDRALRGLVQRLVNAEGIEALTEAAEYFCTHPIDDWPLPVLAEPESQRFCDLVAPIQVPGDFLLVLWRNPDGSPGWDYSEMSIMRT